jgi:hypothetical protein
LQAAMFGDLFAMDGQSFRQFDPPPCHLASSRKAFR